MPIANERPRNAIYKLINFRLSERLVNIVLSVVFIKDKTKRTESLSLKLILHDADFLIVNHFDR